VIGDSEGTHGRGFQTELHEEWKQKCGKFTPAAFLGLF
jgi:hypothetical protein